MTGRVSPEALARLQQETLGRFMYMRAFVLRGRLHTRKWKRLLTAIAKAMSMTPSGEAAVWHYPTPDGAGGYGTTICQPITESFIVVDTWPDHDGAYLVICSCRKFFPGRKLPLVFAEFGLEEEAVSDPITLQLNRERG